MGGIRYLYKFAVCGGLDWWCGWIDLLDVITLWCMLVVVDFADTVKLVLLDWLLYYVLCGAVCSDFVC